ncbi:MAG: LemA family protein [Planctomycetaceae bacterium]
MSNIERQPTAIGKWIPWIVVGALALIAGFWGTGIYNKLVGLDEKVNTSWAQVETVLQRRFDLIPNLVNTVKGYAAHEKEVLEKVTELRSQWGAAKTIDEKAQAAGALESALSRLLLVAERYPDLKADQAFRDLQFELSGTENRISVERQRYNETLRGYNTEVRTFPTTVVARFTGFEPRDSYFEAAETAKDAPKVDFGTEKAPGGA